MKPFIYILILSLLISTQSCNKGLHSKLVEGRVIDVATGMGVPYAEVILSRVGNTFVYTGTGLGTYKCDVNGSFSFRFDANNDELYYLKTQMVNHTTVVGSDTEFFGNEKKRDVTLKLNSQCFVLAHIKSTGKYVGADFNSININSPDSATILASGVSNTEYTYTLFCYESGKPNSPIYQRQTLKLAPFDTGHIYFEY